MNPKPKLRIRRARPSDLDEIMAIEQASFPSPWSPAAMAGELSRSQSGTYLAAEISGEVVGYAGMWCFAGEAHIMNLAVDPDRRREGIGEAILLALIDHAIEAGVEFAYLECRPSNRAAIALYRKLGFRRFARRPSYYRDTGEDALLMVRERLEQVDLSAYWDEWETRHGPRPIAE